MMTDDVLVTADWVESNLDAFQDDDSDLRLVEINNPTVTDESEYTPYEEGHIPGALNFEWDEVFTDETERDIVSKADFAERNGAAGIDADTTVVVYGGGRVPNWFALFGYWIYTYYGHDDVRVIDGGKGYWVDNDYPLSTEAPDFTSREYEARGPFERPRVQGRHRQGDRGGDSDGRRALARGVLRRGHRPEGLNETAQRGGHIPGASNVPIGTTLNEDGTFKSADELRELYADAGVDGDESTITYCRVGERSSIEWFLLHELLGYDDVRNYDGSWTEWGTSSERRSRPASKRRSRPRHRTIIYKRSSRPLATVYIPYRRHQRAIPTPVIDRCCSRSDRDRIGMCPAENFDSATGSGRRKSALR